MEETSSNGSMKKYLPFMIIGGIAGVAVLVMRGGSGGSSGSDTNTQLDAYGTQMNKAINDIQTQEDKRNQEINAEFAQMATALNSLESYTRASIDSENKQLQSAMNSQAQAQAQTNGELWKAQQWQLSLIQDNFKTIMDAINRITPSPTPSAATPNNANLTPTQPAQPSASNNAVVWTRDNGPEAWLRSFGGLQSYGGPLSGPKGERWHTSDVWAYYRKVGRPPTSPSEFINWALGNGYHPH